MITCSMLGCYTSTAVSACEPDKLRDDVRWCLDTPKPNVSGRRMMHLAIEANRPDAFLHGFVSCHDEKARSSEAASDKPAKKNSAISNALACYRLDRRILLEMGRDILGLPAAVPGTPTPDLGTLQLRHKDDNRFPN